MGLLRSIATRLNVQKQTHSKGIGEKIKLFAVGFAENIVATDFVKSGKRYQVMNG